MATDIGHSGRVDDGQWPAAHFVCDARRTTYPGHSDAGPTYADTGPTYSDAGPTHADTGPTYSDAGPAHADTGPAYIHTGPAYGDACRGYRIRAGEPE